jgi:hypothetical protein
MKKFTLNILYFIIPILIIAFPIDYALSHYLKKSTNNSGEFEVWNDIYDSNANSEIAIYGSSRAWVHIDPKIITDSLNLSAYNFGLNGHNFWLQYLRHLELRKFNNKPKSIILAVDIFSLQKGVDLFESDQFLPYMLWNKDIYNFTSSYNGYNILDYYVPLIRYMGKTNSITTSLEMFDRDSPMEKYRQKGFLGMDQEWNDDFEKAKSNMESFDIIIDTQITDLFEKFIIECKSLDINLTLVYTPEYIEGQKFTPKRGEVINFYKAISKKHNIKYLDYSESEICLNKELFYNAVHLNKKGADIFSRKLAHDLKVESTHPV